MENLTPTINIEAKRGLEEAADPFVQMDDGTEWKEKRRIRILLRARKGRKLWRDMTIHFHREMVYE